MMAENGAHESAIDRDSSRESETLMSLGSFEMSDMLPDCRGWLVECATRKQYWCVAAGKTLGLFDTPEIDEPSIVLTLTEFTLDTFTSIEDFEKGNRCSFDIDSIDFSKEIVFHLKSVTEENKFYTFIVAKEEFLVWKDTLQTFTSTKAVLFVSSKEKMIRQERLTSEEAHKIESGLGWRLESTRSSGRSGGSNSPGERRKFPKQMSTESYSDWDIISNGHSRESLSVTTNDDSHSMSDSASVDNISATNLSPEVDFVDSETTSYGRISLNDSVFLGTSQDSSSETKDRESITSDVDLAIGTPHPITSVSLTSGGEAAESSRTTDHNKTVIGKVSKLVHRALVRRRPRVSSGLTFGHLPDLKMSGPMRKKGKSRWYALSGSCLYCFKNDSPDTEAEAILDLALYSIAMATEKKEDGQSIGLLKLTHSTGKKILFSVNNTQTAQQWFNSITDAIYRANDSKASRSNSQKSNSSNHDLHEQGSFSSRLSRESFEESYGYFERRSSLRAERDAVQNAVTEVEANKTQNALPEFASWGVCDDLALDDKRRNSSALQFIKHSVRSSLLFKRNVHQMPIPAAEVVDPTLTGYLQVSTRGKSSLKKYWVVLKDDWLYFYKKPSDSTTSDIIDLTNYTVHRERTLTDDLPLAQQRFMFSIAHSDGSNRVYLTGDSAKETRAWMEKTKLRTKRRSMILDGLNLESGSTTRPLSDLDTDLTRLHKRHLLMELPMIGQQRAPDKAESPVERDDPELAKKRVEILTKYQKANDEEEDDLVRVMTLLNCRRMSAQIKKDALQKRIGTRSKRRVTRIGSIEETEMEEQIRILNQKLKNITSEINTKSSQKTNKLQALKLKKDLELQLLEQQERLSRYRRIAQTTLQDALVELDEESPNSCGSDEEMTETKQSPELTADGVDESDSACKTPERQPGKVPEKFSPSIYRKAGELSESSSPKISPNISPNIRPKRFLPVTPQNTRDNPLKATPPSFESQSKSERDSEIIVENINATSSKGASSEPPARKKSSPLMRLRKISIGSSPSKTSPDAARSSTEKKVRKLSMGMTQSASFDEGLNSVPGKLKSSLRQSSSSSDLRTLGDSPIPQRATDGNNKPAPTVSPQKRRRKISVPLRMPSMENLFSKEKARKSSAVYAPFPRNNGNTLSPGDGAEQKPHSQSLGNLDYPRLRNSSDINGNVPPRERSASERPKRERQAVNDEIDPEVLRDIEEFEMMARKALQEAGWAFKS